MQLCWTMTIPFPCHLSDWWSNSCPFFFFFDYLQQAHAGCALTNTNTHVGFYIAPQIPTLCDEFHMFVQLLCDCTLLEKISVPFHTIPYCAPLCDNMTLVLFMYYGLCFCPWFHTSHISLFAVLFSAWLDWRWWSWCWVKIQLGAGKSMKHGSQYNATDYRCKSLLLS